MQQSNVLGNISGPPPIQPYVSLCVPPVSAGHPSLASLVSSLSAMPFTGLSSLGVSTGMLSAVVTTQVSQAQVNAYRRDSATCTLPLRKKKGHVVQPPGLKLERQPAACMGDVFTTSFINNTTPVCSVVVNVEPPKAELDHRYQNDLERKVSDCNSTCIVF